MIKSVITPLLSLFLVNGFSQNIHCEVHGKYAHPIKLEKLQNAHLISDIIPYFPAAWIMSYVSVEIAAVSEGDTLKASGVDQILTDEQIYAVNSAGLGTEIIIDIKYISENPVNNISEERKMKYSTTVVPEKEAEFPDGYQQLLKYLKGNAIDKLSVKEYEKIEQVVIRFTVDEEGNIANAQIFKTSGDTDIDELLLGAVHNMPKWIPAEDSKGIKVRQEFLFTLSNAGC